VIEIDPLTGTLASHYICESTNIFTLWPSMPIARLLKKEYIKDYEYLIEYELIEPIYFKDKNWLLFAGERFIALYKDGCIGLLLPNKPE